VDLMGAYGIALNIYVSNYGYIYFLACLLSLEGKMKVMILCPYPMSQTE
jgi:hypothetical protein